MSTMTLPEFLRMRLSEEMDTLEHVLDYLEQLEHKPGGISIEGRDVYDVRRVQRDIEAKLRIVERETSWSRPRAGAPPYIGPLNDAYGEDTSRRHPDLVAYLDEHGEQITDTPTLRHLATVYADHPDYREEWRP